MKLRFGVLSTGSIVPRFIHAVRATQRCEVVALASRDIEKAREKAALWGVEKAYGSYEALLCSDAIDVAYIATINTEHYRYAKMALENGKHVLCEKPFVLFEEQVRELFALAREKGLFIMEAQKAVFLPAIQKAGEMIRNGELGRVHMAEFSSFVDPGYNSWQFDPERYGGPLFGNCIYCIEIAQYLFDCQVTQWSGLCTRGSTVVEDQFSVAMLMENGLLLTNRCSTRVHVLQKGILYGEKGFLEIPEHWKARKLIFHREGCADAVFEYPCDYELIYEVLHVEECIAKGMTQSPIMTEERTVNAIRTLRGIQGLWN